MRSSNQQLDQSVTKPSKPATMEIPATEDQYKENISTTRRRITHQEINEAWNYKK
uniref:Uncharacterized protein n=1 Tax=Brassica oleracea TaxID=3712 RepID=A0A3P6CZB8_BRAOL|nr:unnamed protein product [Brassica oleracea]